MVICLREQRWKGNCWHCTHQPTFGGKKKKPPIRIDFNNNLTKGCAPAGNSLPGGNSLRRSPPRFHISESGSPALQPIRAAMPLTETAALQQLSVCLFSFYPQSLSPIILTKVCFNQWVRLVKKKKQQQTSGFRWSDLPFPIHHGSRKAN